SALQDRVATYRCPVCNEAFGAELDRCLGCGASLPHADPAAALRSAGERVVKEVLATVGVVANKVRVGPRAWRILYRPEGGAEATEIAVRLDEPGGDVFFRAPVLRAPTVNVEPLYRLLLTLNDQTTGPYRLEL